MNKLIPILALAGSALHPLQAEPCLLGGYPLPAGACLNHFSAPNPNGERLACLQKEGADGWTDETTVLVDKDGHILWLNQSYSTGNGCYPLHATDHLWLTPDLLLIRQGDRGLLSLVSLERSPQATGQPDPQEPRWFQEASQSGNAHRIFVDVIATIDTIDPMELNPAEPSGRPLHLQNQTLSISITPKGTNGKTDASMQEPKTPPTTQGNRIPSGQTDNFISQPNNAGDSIAYIRQKNQAGATLFFLGKDQTPQPFRTFGNQERLADNLAEFAPEQLHWSGDKRFIALTCGRMNSWGNLYDIDTDGKTPTLLRTARFQTRHTVLNANQTENGDLHLTISHNLVRLDLLIHPNPAHP